MSRSVQPLRRPTLSLVQRELPTDSRRLLDVAMGAAEECSTSLWLVGGSVRDLAAGIPLRDLDVSVDGDAHEIGAKVAIGLDGELKSFPRFHTATVNLGGTQLDVASLRIERYRNPGALPAIDVGATIEQDLTRRDFSVNAIAIGLTGSRRGEVVDPEDGFDDLKSGRLRILHSRSLVDDATRLWRAGRYASRLQLEPTRETVRAIEESGRWLRPISGRRLWTEFSRIANEIYPAAALRILDEWGVLRATSPGFIFSADAYRAIYRRRGPYGAPFLLAVVMAPLLTPEPILDRLSIPTKARRVVNDARRILKFGRQLERTCDLVSEGVTLLDEIEDVVQDARIAAEWLDPSRQRELQESLRRWERTRTFLSGEALLKLGVPNGPALGDMLHRLRTEQYLGNLNSVSEARYFVDSVLRKGESHE